MVTLQNVNEVNRERSRLAAMSSVYDSTKHKGLITKCAKQTSVLLRSNFVWRDLIKMNLVA